jgi:hypothetical protein
MGLMFLDSHESECISASARLVSSCASMLSALSSASLPSCSIFFNSNIALALASGSGRYFVEYFLPDSLKLRLVGSCCVHSQTFGTYAGVFNFYDLSANLALGKVRVGLNHY